MHQLTNDSIYEKFNAFSLDKMQVTTVNRAWVAMMTAKIKIGGVTKKESQYLYEIEATLPRRHEPKPYIEQLQVISLFHA